MRILVVCQHYWPEPYRLADMCEELARRGHTVRVVTDVPNYPMGYIYPEYRNGRNRRQVRNGVEIHRCFTIGRRGNLLFRFLNYYSFALSSCRYVRRLRQDFDLVFTQQTSPVMMSAAAVLWARRNHKPCMLWCQDLWPACAKVGGVKEGSLLYRYFARVSRRIYRRADKLLISSRMFDEYLCDNFGISRNKIEYMPQYADDLFKTTLPETAEKDTLDLVFAGNVGKAQSMPTLLGAAERLRDVPVRFHIVGDGSELAATKQKAAQLGLDNVVFHGRKPPEDMPRYYAMADAMLLCLTADEEVSLTLPAKVQGYMAAGRPILAAANGEVPRVLAEAQCGICVPAEDAGALADAVRAFLARDDRAALGRRARAYYEEHFDRAVFMERMEDTLAACAGKERTRA